MTEPAAKRARTNTIGEASRSAASKPSANEILAGIDALGLEQARKVLLWAASEHAEVAERVKQAHDRMVEKEQKR